MNNFSSYVDNSVLPQWQEELIWQQVDYLASLPGSEPKRKLEELQKLLFSQKRIEEPLFEDWTL